MGLPEFQAEQPTNLLAAFANTGADGAQDRATLVGRELAGYLEGGDSGLDGFLVLLGRGAVGGPGRLVGPGGIGDLQHVGRLHPTTGEVDRMGLHAGEGHGR